MSHLRRRSLSPGYRGEQSNSIGRLNRMIALNITPVHCETQASFCVGDRSEIRMAIRKNINEHGNISTTIRSEEHTSELQSLMRISYAVFCLKKQKQTNIRLKNTNQHKHSSPT